MAPACGSDSGTGSTDTEPTADAGNDTLGRGDLGFDAQLDTPVEADLTVDEPEVDALEVGGDVTVDLSVDLGSDGTFPDPPTGACTEGGNGARGRILFEDATPLAGATVALLFGDNKHLGVADSTGEFYIAADCGPMAVWVSLFESENYPTHPSVWNLPVGTFDASAEEPTFEINLVTVEGVIVDVELVPIPGAILTAELNDGLTQVLNTFTADDDGEVALELVPWADAPYDLTAEGPEDSEKRFRTATLTVLIGDPPPEPSTFILFEDRCQLTGPVVTSESTVLQWLFMVISGSPYPAGAEYYYSFEGGFYYPSTDRDAVRDQVPLFCGEQTLLLTNAYWTNPNWPCIDHAKPDQVCLYEYPVWVDLNVTEPIDRPQIDVVRVGGTVTDELDIAQRDVIVRISGWYEWAEGRWFQAFNETVTDDEGNYSMVIIPQEGMEYTVTARIRDDDRRPLGEFRADAVAVADATTFDIEMPEAPPRCVLTGTVHSSEGRVFNEVEIDFWGEDEAGEPLYTTQPWRFFTEEPNIFYRQGEPEAEIPFVPFYCGDHFTQFHSIDWASCNVSADEVCFANWPASFAGGVFESLGGWFAIDEPLTDGITIPVVHISGLVTTEETGEPVELASVIASSAIGPFNFVMNSTSTDRDGIYDLVVLPGLEWTISVSVGDDHPMNLDPAEWAGLVDPSTPECGDTGSCEVNLEMPRGPDRCPFTGIVVTSDGVSLESLYFLHTGALYGLLGWRFKSGWGESTRECYSPPEFFRDPNDTVILDNIPLYCGEQVDDDGVPYEWPQSFLLRSVWSTACSSCQDTQNFDQPCLTNYVVFENEVLREPLTDNIVVPVVTVEGTVTQEDGTPIPNADVEAFSLVQTEDEEGVVSTVGLVRNFARTRPDGFYRMAVVPSSYSEYDITITTPLEVDLGSITFNEVIDEDTVVDARFSLTD